ncbi:MAG: nickel pincer cofactor biosynthesis protein LarB [Proteobacteria bacterium]|nr:nickel pincer cofactor biosynthesis protein LarB [Pseudomonadota bacterium]
MRRDDIKNLLTMVKNEEIDIEEALNKLRLLPFKDLGFAKVDSHRELRHGFPEVIFGEGKDCHKISAIIQEICNGGQNVLVTRLDSIKAKKLQEEFGEAVYFEDARVLKLLNHDIAIEGRGEIVVVAAGTSDIPVAEEAFLTAEIMGNKVEKLYDVGVAGIHRLIKHQEQFMSASVIIAVAGMEGALPSVISGLVSRPVVAVPTSVGYGASFGGVAALLSMLNSCASGVTVVNIDNGFGAAYAASLMNRK